MSVVMGNHEWRILELFQKDFSLFEQYLEHYHCLDLLDGDLGDIMAFLSTFPYFIDTGDYLIIHTELGMNAHYNQSDVRFLFGADKFETLYLSGIIHKRKQVYGHRARALETIRLDCKQQQSRIGIDGGCVYADYAYLCALNLDSLALDMVKRA